MTGSIFNLTFYNGIIFLYFIIYFESEEIRDGQHSMQY